LIFFDKRALRARLSFVGDFMTLKERIQEDMKAAMRAKDARKLETIRMLQAAIKQKEVDERVTVDDASVLAIADKLIKQRRDSVEQFEKAGRQDLADKEKTEIEVISAYLPQAMTQEEILVQIDEAITQADVSGMAAMGQIMALLKPKLAGRADMGQVSAWVKSKLVG